MKESESDWLNKAPNVKEGGSDWPCMELTCRKVYVNELAWNPGEERWI